MNKSIALGLFFFLLVTPCFVFGKKEEPVLLYFNTSRNVECDKENNCRDMKDVGDIPNPQKNLGLGSHHSTGLAHGGTSSQKGLKINTKEMKEVANKIKAVIKDICVDERIVFKVWTSVSGSASISFFAGELAGGLEVSIDCSKSRKQE